jgi:hypothetical protein
MPSFLHRKMPVFLWESIGQYQQRLGSGTGFGTFGGGGERKGNRGIIAGRGFIVIPPSENGAQIGPGGSDPTEPVLAPASPFFEILQDSNAKMQDSKGFFALACLRFYVVKCLFFLWENMGQYQQRLASGTGFGTFGGCEARKGGFGSPEIDDGPGSRHFPKRKCGVFLLQKKTVREFFWIFFSRN